MDLRGILPINSYQFIVTTDGRYLYNGTGSQLDGITINHFTASYILDTYATESYISSSDIETLTLTASRALIPSITGALLGAATSASYGRDPTFVYSSGGAGAELRLVSLGSPGGAGIRLQDQDGNGYWAQNTGGGEPMYFYTSSKFFQDVTIVGQLSASGSLVGTSSFSTTASMALTASAINAPTGSGVPVSPGTPVAWLNITVSGSIFKLPLYQ